MTATKINTATKTTMFNVDPRSIRFDVSNNPRQDYGDIDSLAELIKEFGLQVPVKVKLLDTDEHGNPEYELIHGFRRMTAITQLLAQGVDIARIPVLTVAPSYNEADALFDHIIQNEGKAFNVLEKAEVIHRLTKMGYTTTEIQQKFGKGWSQTNVSHINILSNAPESIKDLVRKNIVFETVLIDLLRIHKNNYTKVVEVVNDLYKENGEKKVTKGDLGVKDRDRSIVVHKNYLSAMDTLKTLEIEENRIQKVEKILECFTLKGDELVEKLLEII